MEILRKTADVRDLPLLRDDLCTFSMLHRILPQPCEKIVTDHARLILCHSAAPFPVWVWLPQDADGEELARAFQLMREEFPGCTFNVGRALGEYAAAQGMGVSMRMNAYVCDALKPQTKRAEGHFCVAVTADAPLVGEWIGRFRVECGLGELYAEGCRSEAERIIADRRLFLWKDEAGKPRAMCGVRQDGSAATLALVYTQEDSRRRGYAASLTWGVTQALIAQRIRPMLYADADYAASNACYRSVGYENRGEIWTVGDGLTAFRAQHSSVPSAR